MISARPFGKTADGRPVTCWTLTGTAGACVRIIDYGATVQSVLVPDRAGSLTDVVLGYDDVAGYENGDMYIGATIGRHANRIGEGRFTLNGVEYQLDCNNGPNHSHGGYGGFHQRMFCGSVEGDLLKMTLVSPDGDQGYPGELTLTVEFSLREDNALTIHYLAETTKDTVVNLTNHSYFDLSGGQNPTGQCLRLAASRITAVDANTLPTGEFLEVAGTPFDFLTEKPIGRDLHDPMTQLAQCRGYDHNYVLDKGEGLAEMAWLRSPETGITLTMSTDLPGVQLYSGNYISADNGKGGRTYRNWSAVALESQSFPNGMAIPGFPRPVLPAGQVYDHTTVYRFGRE